jgi:hypothetical protein
MIKLSEILNEMPVDVHARIGDFTKGKSFDSPADRHLVTDPAAIQKVRDFFKNTSVDFDFYFVNTKPSIAREFGDHGRAVKADRIFGEYGLGISPTQLENGKIDEDKITIFFVSNYGSRKIPMTPWIIAHRIGHAMRGEFYFNQYTEWAEKQFDILLDYYSVIPPSKGMMYNPSTTPAYYSELRKFELARGRLFEIIGTMKSARDKKLHRREFEFYLELFAQYLKTGQVKFNPLPEKILVGFGPYGSKTIARTRELNDAQDFLNRLENNIPVAIENALNNSVGKIFIM